ncbi:MAG: hypothetical protein R3284_09525, partial [Rubricoccaceae bacterium]|nr:hypothetical protein [Rubricoccaceae bacterium]
MPLIPRLYTESTYSPDGTRLAVVGDGDIYIWSFETANETRLTFEADNQSRPVWSPASQRVLYQSGARQLFTLAANGVGSPELVYRTDADFITP